jgi:hypothetical protein
MNFMKIRSLGRRDTHADGRTDRQRKRKEDRRDGADSCLSQFS